MSPTEFKELHAMAGLSYSRLQEETGVNRSQISEFVHSKGGLREEQLVKIERVLMRAIRARNAVISRLVSGAGEQKVA